MTTGLLTDADERFVLGARNGVVRPTAEPVSDTAMTPFGLGLRTVPIRRVITMGTDSVTTYESDGNEEASDTQTDYNTD